MPASLAMLLVSRFDIAARARRYACRALGLDLEESILEAHAYLEADSSDRERISKMARNVGIWPFAVKRVAVSQFTGWLSASSEATEEFMLSGYMRAPIAHLKAGADTLYAELQGLEIKPWRSRIEIPFRSLAQLRENVSSSLNRRAPDGMIEAHLKFDRQDCSAVEAVFSNTDLSWEIAQAIDFVEGDDSGKDFSYLTFHGRAEKVAEQIEEAEVFRELVARNVTTVTGGGHWELVCLDELVP